MLSWDVVKSEPPRLQVFGDRGSVLVSDPSSFEADVRWWEIEAGSPRRWEELQGRTGTRSNPRRGRQPEASTRRRAARHGAAPGPGWPPGIIPYLAFHVVDVPCGCESAEQDGWRMVSSRPTAEGGGARYAPTLTDGLWRTAALDSFGLTEVPDPDSLTGSDSR